jgi:hypothetical protein
MTVSHPGGACVLAGNAQAAEQHHSHEEAGLTHFAVFTKSSAFLDQLVVRVLPLAAR